MPLARHFIACDLGAESSRVMSGVLADGLLNLTEIHRRPTPVVRDENSLRWDVERLFEQLKVGIANAAHAAGNQIDSISVDSWAVDYVLLGGTPRKPFHYRDPRNAASFERVTTRLGKPFIFEQTGIQFLPFNTLYQLCADAGELQNATTFLTIADYINYRLSGVARIDESNASTTQLFDPRTKRWATELIARAGLPVNIFPEIVAPGTILGPSFPETGLNGAPVIASCSHDTGAAVAAVPAHVNDNWAYLSSGTWSLLGVELPQPLVNDAVRDRNYTNEAGYAGTTRFLKNIVGLWILQELRRAWVAGGNNIDYAAMNALAAAAEPFRSLIDPRDPRFAAPDDMPAKIAAFCRETNQPEPRSPGEFARCALESLALLYRATVEEIEALTGRTIDTIHVVGGGSRSDLLNEFTACAACRTVIAGPVEASAAGNVLVQAAALGELHSLDDIRACVRRSFAMKTYTPAKVPEWSQAFDRFQGIGILPA